MEPFEPIRKAAAELHEAATLVGANPFDPLGLIEAMAKQLDLNLVWLSKGHPALKGARALFDHQSGTVICETAGDPGERAQLAAHEIGHSCVHTSSWSCREEDIDASRSTEAAPVGLQKVEDYGAHERRELQANVFARECLFPRALASRLHLEDGLSAISIASKTGLPKNLVRQQLFDAILLPPPPDVASASSRIASEDPSQDRAAAHRNSPFQLQAGPGTGKTRTLEKRVKSLLDEGVDPAAILILTFSNRAAGELADRLNASIPAVAPRIWIGTFHAFGLDLVRRHHDLLALSPDPALFDRSDAIEVLEEILPTLPIVHYRNLWDPAMVLREIVAAISRAKDELVDHEGYRQLAQAMLTAAKDDASRIAAEKCLEVAHVYKLYQDAIRSRGAVDFGDLIMRPTLLLEENPHLQAALQLRHRHVLVDEYQDVNRASGRLLKAISGDGRRLWVVGDSRQSIYRFRGASSTNMGAFKQDYEGAISDQLLVNYRSTQQVVDLLIGIAPRMGASGGMMRLDFTSDRGPGPTGAEVRRYNTLDDEAEGVAASVLALRNSGVAFRDQAVLCRSNKRLNEIAEALEVRGIPVLHLGSLFERDEIRDMLALLSLAIDRFGDGLTRVGAIPRYGLSLQDIYVATRQLRSGDARALSSLRQISEAEGISPQGRTGIQLLADDLAELTISSSAWEFLSHYLLDRSGLLRELAAGDSVSARMRAVALWQLLNFVREQSPTGTGLPIQRTLDRVRQLVLLAEERDLRQVPTGALHLDAVRLMTVHGSKGLEFEAVHVPGLTVASFPTSNRGQRCPPPRGMIAGTQALTASEEAKQSQEHEEQCLFFVAASRARTHLRLYLARFQPSGSRRSASPFLDWIPSNLVREIAAPTMLPPTGGSPPPRTVVITNLPDSVVTDSQISLYEKCPLRFFYTHILGLGSARKPTAFSKSHDCLYRLIDWLADARRNGDPTLEETEAAFEVLWLERGPTDHAYAAEYRLLASRLITALIRSGAGRTFRDMEPLAIDFPNGRIVVRPNELAELPNGTVVLRRVRTGHRRTDEYDRLDYTLYQLAGESRFGAGFVVEALHLTDETIDQVEIKPQKLENRRVNSDGMLRNISLGAFPPEVDAVSCPRCPHFFICSAVPPGTLNRT
ncbi:MAG: ATP-dependent helicase [Bryobacteraceae bacterium]